MKTNIYRPVLIRILLFILISLYFITVFGQSPSSYRRENLVVTSSCMQKYSSLNQVDFSNVTLMGASHHVSLQAMEFIQVNIITYGVENAVSQTINSGLYFGNHYCLPYSRNLNLVE